MAIITWQPLRELNTLRQQMDSLFELGSLDLLVESALGSVADF